MIYIITLIAILCCVLVFDVGKLKNPQLKSICYSLLLFWLIALSGFAYNVGSDTPRYMREYGAICQHQFKTWEDLSYLENRQPGWMILNILCSKITHKFVLMKLLISIFTNTVILSFLKKHSKYVFLGILFYYVCLYLNMNFNVLRQAVAVSFFLLGYDYLVEKKLVKYYLFVACAYMFHPTAIICTVFPFFHIVRLNIKSLLLILTSILALLVIAIRLGGADMISSIMLNNIDFVGLFTDREQIVESYFGEGAAKYEGLNLFGLVFAIFSAIPIMLVLLGGTARVIKLPNIALWLVITYLALYFLDFVIPVVFMRFVMYVEILYYCFLSDFVIEAPRKIPMVRHAISIVLICMVLFRPVTTLFSENESSGLEYYKQFYPYYSVFNPKIDTVRSIYFDAYKE